MTAPTTPPPRAPPVRLVALFGALGLIPFWAPLALALAAPAYGRWALGVQAVYAGLILSFLGGARFGRALDAPGGGATVAISMVPSIVALGVLAAPVTHAAGALALALALVAAFVWDVRAPGLPASYKRLRAALTVFAAAALTIGALLPLPVR
jgi:hypothetical protein